VGLRALKGEDVDLSTVDADTVVSFLGDAFKADFTKMTLAFTVAAWLHRSWVKKDIKSYFNALTAAIDNVADKVSGEMVSMKKDMLNIATRVEALEKKGVGK
jgi:hypothetical protein